MGSSTYSISDRTYRASTAGFYTKSVNEVFTQQKERKAHLEMMPTNISFRESCDSEAHPNTVPVQLYLDVTGSMGHIPHDFIKDGLPTLIGKLIQNGVPDVSLMFGAIGDHECDHYPLQVAQFESGDKELDMWLTRTYLEGNGGSNAGESYLLAWYFAAFHTRTDAWDKRGKKGFVFTIGDEPTLPHLPQSAIKQIMGSTAVGQAGYTAAELLAAAQEKNYVYHIFLEHGHRKCDFYWKEMMGPNLIIVKDYREIPSKISETILNSEFFATAVEAKETPNPCTEIDLGKHDTTTNVIL